MIEAERAFALESMLGCSPDSAAALAKAMILRELPGKTVLLHQGDSSDTLWLILSGAIQFQAIGVEGQSTVISTFGPGELVGSYPDATERSFEATTTQATLALQIGAGDLTNLLKQHPDLGAGLAAIFSGQLDTVLDRLSARVSLSAVGRFYRELLRMADELEAISPPPVVSSLALIAQTTRETGSRALGKLERRGIVERNERELKIVSRRMLEELVV